MIKIELGDKVKDLITGFEGIAVSRTEFINGCVQFGVAKQLKKGDKVTPETFGLDPSIDSKSLRVVKKRAVDLREEEDKSFDFQDYEDKEIEKVLIKKKKKKKHSGGAITFQRGIRGY
jgi:hypothetical protein